MAEEEWSLYHNASLHCNIRNWTLRVFERIWAKFVEKIVVVYRVFHSFLLIFGRYVFIIVLFVTLISCTIFVLCRCRIMLRLRCLNWITLGFGSVHMSQKWLWYSPGVKCFLNQEIQQNLQHQIQEGLFFLLILQNTNNPPRTSNWRVIAVWKWGIIRGYKRNGSYSQFQLTFHSELRSELRKFVAKFTSS